MLAEVTLGLSWPILGAVVAGLTFVYLVILRPIYNVYFHPLRKYPGPKLWAASVLQWGFSFMAGNMHNSLMDIHTKYGPIVRVGPNELSYAIPEAWDDVYGRYRAGKRKENQKPSWYLSKDANDILGAATGDHGRMRKILSNGFTTNAMLEQEPAIAGYVDLLILRLKERAEDGKAAIDLWQWFVYCLFDVTGDLAFGEPFGCLRESMMHPWISFVLSNIKLTYIILLCTRIPFFFFFAPVLATIKLVREYAQHRKVLRKTVDRRLALNVERPDLVQVMLTQKDGLKMSQEEIYSNAVTLTLAGAETTASALSGIMYMLASYPEVKAKLMKELQDAFKSEDEINMRSAMQLRYLAAVIDETFRYHPPGPNALWRTTPPEGNWILGDFIPGNIIVGIPHRVMYRSEANFKRADEFIPERWLADSKTSEFSTDRREGFHPFSYGPRNCIGLNLANAEMRFILARVWWNFDVEVTQQSRGWMDKQRSYLMWEKGGLHMYLKPKYSGSGASL
ncbi:Cytochrome P450 monooxygenase hmp1 [Colletotrichum aenigma]|uniref:Cytochrome P450 monooxygenase hmp1 n=1 Tax=Colletotrichum aenigma TaxID=1215731 RepID=UPI001872F1E8|nr:Cytochrome P450 monooxygenase hmp1 [Colletotrichum aenigma]KAF5518689.1 Cytochrome P450 monooxygenase hmp1 [Colletotrichum aenigma]